MGLLTEDALVLRTSSYKESDRLCTLLTRTGGVIRAYARGARNLKNKNFAATNQLSYARFTLFSGKDGQYSINDSHLEHIFVSVLADLDRLTLAQYLCELAEEMTPPDKFSEGYLVLMLRALHALSDQKRSPALIKAATELRILSMSGFMPDLIMCSECGEYETDLTYFMPATGTIRCGQCGPDGASVQLSRGALTAMRHCIYTDIGQTFSFSLSEPSLGQFENACERYLTERLERSFNTLDFYRSLRSGQITSNQPDINDPKAT